MKNIVCVYCGKDNVIKNGKKFRKSTLEKVPSETQNYCCKDCGKNFILKDQRLVNNLKPHSKLFIQLLASYTKTRSSDATRLLGNYVSRIRVYKIHSKSPKMINPICDLYKIDYDNIDLFVKGKSAYEYWGALPFDNIPNVFCFIFFGPIEPKESETWVVFSKPFQENISDSRVVKDFKKSHSIKVNDGLVSCKLFLESKTGSRKVEDRYWYGFHLNVNKEVKAAVVFKPKNMLIKELTTRPFEPIYNPD